jgi:mono/diheme cytochrome c family protein
LLATFRKEHDLRDAVRTVRSRGATILNAYCPYAVHGLDEDLGWRSSRLTWACGIGGAVGALFITWFQFWTSAVNWPVNVGGKPFNSLPAYVPVIFEAMVLCGAFGTVLAFFFVARLRPGKRATLIRPHVTDDRFVLVIEQSDARFDSQQMTALLEDHHAEQIEEKTIDDQTSPSPDRTRDWPMLRWVNIGLFVLLVLAVVAVLTVPRNFARPNLEFLPTMRRSVPLESQTSLADIPVSRPIPGTIARDARPLNYQATEDDAKRAAEELQSPFAADDVTALDRGRYVFFNFCISCHGPSGLGDGPMALRGFPPPPPLGAEKSRLLKDGELFHVISYGRNNMPPHRKQLSQDDRWKALLYVRELQRQTPQQADQSGDLAPTEAETNDSPPPNDES